MKTQQISRIKSALATFTFLILLAITFNSCQKEESTPTSSTNSQKSADEMSNNVSKVPALGMAIVKIDHRAERTMLPDYSVTLYADGKVIFKGRKNVQAIGQTWLNVSNETVLAVKRMIQNSTFFSMNIEFQAPQGTPYTVTSCSMVQQPATEVSFITNKSLSDYNNGYPKALFSLRANIESQLPVQELIGQ